HAALPNSFNLLSMITTAGASSPFGRGARVRPRLPTVGGAAGAPRRPGGWRTGSPRNGAGIGRDAGRSDGSDSDPRQNLGLVEGEELRLVGPDLAHVNLVEPRLEVLRDRRGVTLRIRPARDDRCDVVLGDVCARLLEVRRHR